MTVSRYSFLRWVRSGAAGSIAGVEGAGEASVRACFPVVLRVTGIGDLPAKDVALHGPGDVVGVSPRQIIRRFPAPGATTADPGSFAHIEFDDPDLPWRYTPFHEHTRADAPHAVLRSQGTLTPWLCLVVVEQQDGVSLTYDAGDLLATLTIASPAVPDDELPLPGEIASWAHVQITGDLPTDLTDVLTDEPARTLARLVCPRLLKPRTSYHACLVPVFASGRQAGLGQPVDAPLDDRAWATGDTLVRLPVYDSFRFATGNGGDFESLVRRLRPVRLDELGDGGTADGSAHPAVGTRPLDVTTPGFGVPDRSTSTSTALFGALQVEGANPLEPFDAAFGDVIAAAADVADAVAPPVYGRWHAAATVPGRAGWPTWLARLNRDPGLRTVAGQGAHIVQERQEEFMAACWEQVGAITEANQLLRQAQLGQQVSAALYRRHVAPLQPVAALLLLGSALSRLPSPTVPGRTQWADLESTCLPMPALSGAFRRLTRPRGPLVRRIEKWQKKDLGGRYDPAALVSHLAAGDRLGPPPVLQPAVQTTLAGAGAGWGAQPTPATWPVGAPAATDLVALQTILGRLAKRVPAPPTCTPADLTQAAAAAVTGVDPARTIPRRARAQLDLPAGLWDPPDRIDPIMVAPEITTPMYPAVVALGQDWLLPGLQHVPSDSMSALVGNQVFVESLLTGMNHEMSRELLWRGYPTDQRGTVFRHFWDRRLVAGPSPGDITALHTWKRDSELGSHLPATLTAEEFVFLVRGELLVRFPRASVFLVPATMASGTLAPSPVNSSATLPVFSGWLDPGVSFLGFDVPADDVRGANPPTAAAPGWFVVIQEQVSQPTFGVGAASGDVGQDGRYASWPDLGVHDLVTVGGHRLDGDPVGYLGLADTVTTSFAARSPIGSIDWDGRSDNVAAIFLRRPFRLFLHGADLLPLATR